MSKKDSEKRGQSDKPKKKKNAIVANLEFCCYPIVHRCVKSRGWRVAEKNERWDFGWSDNNQLLKELGRQLQNPQHLSPVQRLNHTPNMKQLYRKDYLAQNMKLLTHFNETLFNFSPRAWNIPEDLQSLQQAARCAENAATPKTYICKPSAGLQGKGIWLTQQPLQAAEAILQSGANCVIQEYVSSPMLLDGYKFDLRLYVTFFCI
jgi:tubulin polyglutamylase TTLL6/13